MAIQQTLKAISDPVRRRILELLRGGKLSAGEIAAQFDLSGATVSHHLSQLKKAGLIEETRYKNYIYYELNATVLQEALVWIAQFTGQDGGAS